MSFSLKPTHTKLEPEGDNDSDIVAILDIDWCKYSVAGVAEKRTIKVTHKDSGRVKEFNNRTEFWGRGKKVGGWLGEQNEKREEKGLEPFSKEDFEIEDVREAEPVENALHSAKLMVLGALEALGTNNYEAYLGKGDSFRVGLSTLKKYKGNRDEMEKPLLLDEVTAYLIRTFAPVIVQGVEADDAVVMRAYGDPNAVIVGEDKDYRSQPIKFFDVNRPEEGIIQGDCYGELWLDDKKKVRGRGRKHLYFQMISQDTTDNFKANCHSDKKWGEMSAYKALKDCENDQEALQVLIDTFKTLYPEPKYIESWQGNNILIDWYYVANEMFNMARMLRWEGDHMSFSQWCYEYGVKF